MFEGLQFLQYIHHDDIFLIASHLGIQNRPQLAGFVMSLDRRKVFVVMKIIDDTVVTCGRVLTRRCRAPAPGGWV